MIRHCGNCGRRLSLRVKTRLHSQGMERPLAHDLCQRCWRTVRTREHARRLATPLNGEAGAVAADRGSRW
jgi:hypothetical protein